MSCLLLGRGGLPLTLGTDRETLQRWAITSQQTILEDDTLKLT